MSSSRRRAKTTRITPSRAGGHLAAVGPERPKLRGLCLDRRLTANDLPDAWLSAAVTQAGEHLVSFDRDFRRLLPRGQFTPLATGLG